MRIFIVIMLVSFGGLMACEDGDYKKGIELHVRNNSTATSMFALTTTYTKVFDSTTFKFEGASETDFSWDPALRLEGTFVFGANGLRDTLGYYINGVMPDSDEEFFITIFEDSLAVSETGF